MEVNAISIVWAVVGSRYRSPADLIYTIQSDINVFTQANTD
jgi:hypothetical protein